MLTLTPKACEKIGSFLKTEESAKGKALRVKLEPSGCAGFEYKMTFDEKAATDVVVPQEGFEVIVDAESARFVENAVIDYAEDETSAGFRIKNPLEKSSCGCGKSKQF